MNDWNLVLIVWFPHSGCRWLNRSLLAKHSKISNEEFFLPYLTHSTDMILNLDRTSQVHKSRSLNELKEEFDIVKESVEFGRKQGIKRYLELKLEKFSGSKAEVCVGALSPGAPEPLIPDLESLVEIKNNIKILHLVRNPISCFGSMNSRLEMDGDPYKISSLWSGFNSQVRNFGKKYGDNYFCLKFEDLTSDTPGSLKKLCDWIGIEFEESMIQGVGEYHGKNKNKNIKETIGAENQQVISELTKSEKDFYHYK